MSVNIGSDNSTDELRIDPTSKAARVTGYKSDGTILPSYAVRNHYRAATTNSFVAAAGTGVFFAIQGSSSKTIRVISIRISGMTLTTAAYLTVLAQKTSTAVNGGTSVALVKTPNDSEHAASSISICNVYTAAPTAGTLVGTISSQRFLAGDTTPVALTTGFEEVLFYKDHEDGLVLRGIEQGLTLSFASAPATAVTMALEVIWTENGD